MSAGMHDDFGRHVALCRLAWASLSTFLHQQVGRGSGLRGRRWPHHVHVDGVQRRAGRRGCGEHREVAGQRQGQPGHQLMAGRVLVLLNLADGALTHPAGPPQLGLGELPQYAEQSDTFAEHGR